MRFYRSLFFFLLCVILAGGLGRGLAQSVVSLPPGVEAVWDLNRAYREATPTRERVCINGLWRWQPAVDLSETVPPAGWGYFKVPGCWPGITDYMQKDSQTLFADPAWKNARLDALNVAWYQREITIPAEWAGRRITLSTEYLNSFAAVYVDGRKAGEMRFPAGEVDLTASCRPGQTHILSLRVEALPLNAVLLSYIDTSAAREVKGSVPRRGLCGDVYLVGTPQGARISDVKVNTSVRRWEITFRAGVQNLAPNARYALHARILDNGRSVGTFAGKPFLGSEITDGYAAFTEHWKPAKLWDIHTPQNLYIADLSLVDVGGKVLDAALPAPFGFREFQIQGKDFYLNGSRIFLSGVPLDNAQIGAGLATYDAVRETLRRLKSFGVNLVYTHNYDCEPGSHLSFEETLRAADAEGVLVSLSQPHFSH
ncbi:MAG: hypothetical protein JWL77_2430, partial [Chthonomonadaceae bacterium]|nr:hypothetical protein [Chthonomonadaceae bacterium]